MVEKRLLILAKAVSAATRSSASTILPNRRNPSLERSFVLCRLDQINTELSRIPLFLPRRPCRGVFRNVEELIMAIGDYIDRHNENPKPFIWTAKASHVLEK